MTADCFKTLILHRDPAWRRRATASLAAASQPCADAGSWHEWAAAHRPCDITTVLLQLLSGDQMAETLLAEVRKGLPSAAVIAIVPARDTTATRMAFKSGVQDCLEEPVDWAELTECLSGIPRIGPQRQRPATATPHRTDSGPTVLTGHSAFLDTLTSLRGLCRRHGQPLSIMILDLDRFRDCNEYYSPTFGDHVLGWFASILKGICRSSDIVAQYQADRFIVALPGSTATQAREFAHRCREAMRTRPVIHNGQPFEITTSVGMAESTIGFIETEHQLIRRALIALEQAKHRDSDRTLAWSELLDTGLSRRVVGQLGTSDVSRWVERLRQHVRSTCVESTRALVAAVEAKDPYTEAHSLTVASYAEAIGKRMQLPGRMVKTLGAAALLHDVGKIGVPDAILTKPGPLSEAEFNIIKRHPETALEILGHVSFLSDERPLILHHHERFNGTGYPAGLAGDHIPIGARILAVADALDTMFAPRTYKDPYSMDRVRDELIAGAAGQFDPSVTDVTIRWLNEAPADFALATAPGK